MALHSEYRSTYRWHEYTGPRQEIIRRPPQPAQSRIEPALPRRKKNPALAYKTHEFLAMSDGDGSNDSLDATVAVDRARMIASVQPTGGVLKNAISRISTEYRLQFAWPRGSREATNNTEEDKTVGGSGPPRKSLSMGAIKPAGYIMPHSNGLAAVHKKRITDADRRDGGSELEPLVGSTADGIDYEGGEEKIQEEIMSKEEKEKPILRSDIKTEYKKKFRPFSQYDYVEGRFKPKKDPEPLPLQDLQQGDSWYREVLELRKKAGEYKHRGWGTELVPQHIAELYNKQMTLWEQVSRRSSLSALSLASTTPRSISKEEKEKENNKKSSPTKAPWSRQSPNRPAAAPGSQKKAEKIEDNKKEAPRSRKETVMRHHLERTTGAGRSQSVGPNTTFSSENRSPKRTPRPGGPVKAHVNGSVQPERRPRPTTLTTTAPSRTKSSSGSATKHKAPVSATKNAGHVAKPRTVIAETKSNKEEPISTAPAEEVVADEVPVIDTEPVVKSPPEPTRVKSPEQILMRSPEPVNWTVPLDTGKTFTVTQNVREGELVGRPHSELKAWTPPAAPPAAPQSAPPQLPPEGMLMNNDTEKDQCDSIQASISLESLEVSNIMQQSNPINNFVALSELSQSPNQDSSSGFPSLSMSETLTQPTEQTQMDVLNFSKSVKSNVELGSTDLSNSVNNLPNLSKDIVTNADIDNTSVSENTADFQNSFSNEKKFVHDIEYTDRTGNIYNTHTNKNGVKSVEEEKDYPSMQYSLEVDRLFSSTTVEPEPMKAKEQNNCVDLKQGAESKNSQEQPIVNTNE